MTTLLDSLAGISASNAKPRGEFAYVDESGNTGPVAKGGTRTFTVGCLLVPMDQWSDRLDIMVEARRAIRDTYKVRMKDELKANHLLRGRGPLDGLDLGDGQRRDIWRRLLSTSSIVCSSAVAVVIDKERLSPAKDPFDTAWEYLLQRLRIRSEAMGHPIMLINDAGEVDRIRTLHRRFRRHSWAPGGKSVASPLLIEDPVPRDSRHSYFIQAADLAAFSAFRRIQPPTVRAASVCSGQMWDTLEPRWMTAASNSRRDGIVLYP